MWGGSAFMQGGWVDLWTANYYPQEKREEEARLKSEEDRVEHKER